MTNNLYDPWIPDGTNGKLDTPISADGIPEVGTRYLIPAREGRAVRM